MRTITIHNTSGIAKSYEGQSISIDETYTVTVTDLPDFIRSPELFADVASGSVLVGDSTGDIVNAITGWAYFIGDEVAIKDLPFSDIEGLSLAVHPSYKPRIEGGTTYAVWTGAGDDVNVDPNLSVLGEGDLLHFNMVPANATETKDIKFDHTAFGRVWIHEAYLKFMDGGESDHISADVMASGAVLQQAGNLDLEIDGSNYVVPAAGGPGTGTDGWAASPVLIPRTFSMDGDWDYDGVTLSPNIGAGAYKISTDDKPVHKYVNKIATYGSQPYFSMSSDETAELLPGYFLRVTVNNGSSGTWHLCIIMEIYRERTVL